MIGKAIRNLLLGILAAATGTVTIVLFWCGIEPILHPILALPLIIIGLILIGSFFVICGEHTDIVSKNLLSNMCPEKGIDIISCAARICLEERCGNWWRSQKEEGLNGEHLCHGIFISILGGVLDREDTIKYSEHAGQCPMCRNYAEKWTAELALKAKELYR